eukprot:1328657-Amorphochlora_amoeboformis.AAC.1
MSSSTARPSRPTNGTPSPYPLPPRTAHSHFTSRHKDQDHGLSKSVITLHLWGLPSPTTLSSHRGIPKGYDEILPPLFHVHRLYAGSVGGSIKRAKGRAHSVDRWPP